MKTEFKLKDMPTKKQFTTFVNERLFDGHKIKRISTYTKNCIIFQVIVKSENMLFCPGFARVQSISNYKGKISVCFTVSNNIYQIGSIIGEIDYFRRFPMDAQKRNLTVI